MRLGDLGQTFASVGVGVTPGGVAFQFAKHFRACLLVHFASEVPEVFYQLQALKPAWMFDGLQCGIHDSKPTSGAIWRQYQ